MTKNLVTESTRTPTLEPLRPVTDADSTLLRDQLKATWESGDFGQVARFGMSVAEEFMARLDLRAGRTFLDAACGTGNLAILAARAGCVTWGIDIASNLIAQARDRGRGEGFPIEFSEGDAEALPYPNATFDVVASMFGVMFAPHPERIASELVRVTKPGGLIALAHWTPEGFIGRMFDVFKRHLPATPPATPSPLEWGSERIVQERLDGAVSELRLTRRVARLRYPFSPAGTVEFLRRYYGPTLRAFASLPAEGRAALRHDLERLQARHNVAGRDDETEIPAEYLEIQARA
jgi:SAM-dependent methyltransferase